MKKYIACCVDSAVKEVFFAKIIFAIDDRYAYRVAGVYALSIGIDVFCPNSGYEIYFIGGFK
jgi:hypothetical protein